MPKKSAFSVLLSEVLNPFYIFQCLSVTLWIFENYILYSVAIMTISTFVIGLTLYQTLSQNKRIREMARYDCNVKRWRPDSSSTEREVSSVELVPGDLIEIPRCILPCDVVLLTGSVIVNEAMLTGESVPVIKSYFCDEIGGYREKEAEKHTLFGGTNVIMTRTSSNEPAIGLVTKTGFLTSKGGLIRGILYPKPVNFSF